MYITETFPVVSVVHNCNFECRNTTTVHPQPLILRLTPPGQTAGPPGGPPNHLPQISSPLLMPMEDLRSYEDVRIRYGPASPSKI
jgi:hypothetical protein